MGARGGEVFREVVNQNIIEMLHRRKVKVSEVRTNVIPHRATTRELFPNGLEGWTAELLRLVHQERQHHQQREDHGQVLPTVAKVVLKLVTLILQRVERLIFHFPTRTTTAYQMQSILLRHHEIRDPTEIRVPVTRCIVLAVLQKVHQQIGIALVQRKVVNESDLARHISFLICPRPRCLTVFVERFDHLLEQMLMIVLLGSQNEMHSQVLELSDVGSITGKSILDHDQLQMRVFLANLLQQAFGGVPFAVILIVAILLDDRFGRERDDLSLIRMYQDGSQHLMIIGDLAGLFVASLKTRVAMYLFGREVFRAIEGQ